MGKLSAAVTSSCCAVRTMQEKSRAIVRIPERPVRCRVFAILRATPSKRAVSTASSAPLIGGACRSVNPRLLNSHFNNKASRSVLACAGARVDDDGGKSGFDNGRPRHSQVRLQHLETMNRGAHPTGRVKVNLTIGERAPTRRLRLCAQRAGSRPDSEWSRSTRSSRSATADR